MITEKDIRKVNKYLATVSRSRQDNDDLDVQIPEFIWENPHLLMPLAFDDYYGIDFDMADDYRATLSSPVAPRRDPADPYVQHVRRKFGLSQLALDFWVESLYRDHGSGSWFWFEGITEDNKLHFVGPRAERDRYVTVDDWLGALTKAAASIGESSYRLWLPQLFTPAERFGREEALSNTVMPILAALEAQKTTLQELSWRNLEELVAELLRARGMQVYVTPKSRDSGRDIIARGELIAGEPTIIAVEVKQRPVVGLADVQRALKANEDFPSLMVATSGRFSSGVIREKTKARHELRLFLKDGVALSQWVDGYMQNQRFRWGVRRSDQLPTATRKPLT